MSLSERFVVCAVLLAGCGSGGPPRAASARAAVEGLASEPRAIPSDIAFQSLEGPFWVASGGYLLFSDVIEQNRPGAAIYRYVPETRAFSVVAYPGAPVSSNGLAVDGRGGLLVCERWNGSMVRVADGVRTVLADRSPTGLSLNAPNDVAVRQDGNLYFTDTRWGARPGVHANPAVYRLSPSGVLYVAFEVDMPNGVALAPDGRSLYVGSDAQHRLWRLALDEHGRVGEPAPFPPGPMPPAAHLRVPDGMCVDDLGRLYVTNNSAESSAIIVFEPDGRFAGRIPMPAPPSNCSFGGPDRRTLYVTTLHALYEARATSPGLP